MRCKNPACNANRQTKLARLHDIFRMFPHNGAMKTLFAMTFIFGALYAADQKISLKDMPPAVQQAVMEQSKGATVRGYAKEVEDGTTSYEAELTVNGRAKDISFGADGKVLAVEEVVTVESIPAPARAAIQKAVGTGELNQVESVTERGTTNYEAAITRGGKKSEVKVDATGKAVR
jgi:uncharacterized membrane protein YkoI